MKGFRGVRIGDSEVLIRAKTASSKVEPSDAVLEWLFRLNYPFDFSWPGDPPPIDHHRLAAMWNERDEWGISDEDAYLCVCAEAGIEP